MSRNRAQGALALLVPVPSLGTWAAMELFPGAVAGQVFFLAAKLWLLGLPFIWLTCVENKRPGISPARRGGWAAGVASGAVLGMAVLVAFIVWGRRWLDETVFIAKMHEIGLGSPPAYLAGAIYWVLLNSLLEEYAWRWFVHTRWEQLTGPAAALVLTALCFTLHHVIALRAYLSLPLTLVCSAGVFLGGAVWSFLYLKYRSVWPGYVSHVMVNLVLFGIGGFMLYGR